MAKFKTQSQNALAELKLGRELGLELLKEFYNSSLKKISFDDLIKTLEGRVNQKHFVSILGGAVLNSKTPKSEAVFAMRKLGKASNGRIPARNGDFISAIVEKATSISYVDAVLYTATETAKTIGEGAVAVGDTLISTGKILNFIFPAVVLIVIYLLIKKKVA